MTSLDHVDLELIAALSADPRATVVALAEKLHLSRNTVQARMARLDQTGVFQSFERSIAPAALGFPLQAFVSIGLDQSKMPQIIEELRRVPEIIEAHGVSGQVDLFALVACRDARHLFDVDARILAIPGIERSETRLVMSESISYRVSGLMELARREARR